MASLKLTDTTNDKLAVVFQGGPAVLPAGPTGPQTISSSQDLNPANGRTVAIEPQVGPKIALVGTAPSSKNLAPFGDQSWQIWVCSAGNMNQVPRVDLWFEIHCSLLWPENQHFGKPYVDWLNQQTFPVYMQDNSLVPRAMALPLRELIEEFGQDFFTSSFSWMLAMAIKKGASEIALYGIDMASRDEYILQRPGFYFFRHIAQKRGIKVTAPHESDIMQSPPLYGFSEGTPFGLKIAARDKELKDRVAAMKQQRDGLSANITYLEGAIEDIDYMKSIWSGVDVRT